MFSLCSLIYLSYSPFNIASSILLKLELVIILFSFIEGKYVVENIVLWIFIIVVGSLRIVVDSLRIVVGCFDAIKIINVNTLIIENELNAHEVWINCLCITPDGLLFSGDSEGILVLWEISGEGKKIYSEKKDSAIKTIDLLSEDKIIVGLLNSCIDILKYK